MKFEIDKTLEVLSKTPDTLISLLGELSGDWTEGESNNESWSAFDVVGHLIHGEKTDWIPRAKIILAQADNVTFVPFDRFAQFEDSKGKTLADLLDEFTRLRRENLSILREMNLTQSELQLKGMHPELGEVTLEQLLSTWLVHDLTHIRQIVIELAKKYADNVGVWKEYLTILK